MKISVFTSEEDARALWQEFVPKSTAYEQWDLRALFATDEAASPHFILAEVEDNKRFLLPLQENPTRKRYEFFGGVYMEENSFYPRDAANEEKCGLYELVPTPCSLTDISSEEYEAEGLEFEEFKYVADLSNVADIEQFIEQQFQGKSKANFKKRIRQAEAASAEILEAEDADIEHLFQYNIKNFGENSSFFTEGRQQTFWKLLASPLETHLLKATSNDGIAAVSLGLRVNDDYVYVNAGVDKERYPNVGTLLILENVKRALSLGCKRFDAGVEDLGWKERWHLTRIPQYRYQR